MGGASSMTFRLSADVKARIGALQQHVGATSMGEVARWALATYELLVRLPPGSRAFVRHADGTEQVIRLPSRATTTLGTCE